MTKTREQLNRQGIRLAGPQVPGWFRDLADGCSVPRGLRWIMQADRGRAACMIHDWRYYCAAIANGVADPIRAKNRMMADYELKQNRSASMRSRAVGWLFGSLYFRGVRAGGAYAMRDRVELMDRVPEKREDLEILFHHIRLWYPDRDQYRVVSIWSDMVMTIKNVTVEEEKNG